MFNFTGSEKAAVALAPIFAPLTVVIQAVLAYTGMGAAPDPELLAGALAFIPLQILGARLVWQVPNSTPIPPSVVEIEENPS